MDGSDSPIHVLPTLSPSLQLAVACSMAGCDADERQTDPSDDRFAAAQPQTSNADETGSDDAASERRSKGDRRQRTCRGKNKIQPVVQGGLRRFICPLCKTGFDQQHELTMHIRAHNSDGSAVNECTLCGKQLSSQSSLDRHMLVHSGERPFCCRICAMSFTTNGNMHRHMAVHEKDMPTEWKLMMSEKRRRRKSAKLAKSEASATSTSIESANISADVELTTNDNQSGCSSAPAETEQAALANLNAVWLSQVPFLQTLSKFLKPLPASASATHSEADSDSDEMTDMADEVKPTVSPRDAVVAPQQDATSENLDVDMVNGEETNDDRPRLRIVSESESVLNSLAESSNSCVNLTSENRDALITTDATPLTERSGAQKLRKCRFCTLAFPTVNALRLHVRSHHGLSPFRCQVCEYTSVDKSTLVRHMRTHNGQRPFRCTECGYAFTTKANCERHVKTRHQKTTKQELLGAVAIVSAAQSPSPQPSGQSHSADPTCPVCRKSLPSWRLVKRHMRMRHVKRKTRFAAALPPLEFAQTQVLASGSEQEMKVAADEMKHEPEPAEQLQLAVNCVQNPPLIAAAFDYASWLNLVGAFHKLAATNVCAMPTIDSQVRSDEYSEHEQTEPLDLTVKPHTELVHASDNSLSVGIGAPQHDSGFSSAKTLSPDGAFEMQTDTGAPLGSLALLAFYQNVLAASNQFALTSASQCAGSQQCAAPSAFTTARSHDAGTLIDAHSHNNFDYSPESARSDENETRDDERADAHENKDGALDCRSENDSESDVELDVCDNDESGGARADSLAIHDADNDGQPSCSLSDASCTQQTADEALSETEVGASKKKRNSYSDSPRRIQCPYCTRSFPWISSLKRHLITHTGQKPFRCPRCSLNFSTKSNRERHLQRKHGVKVHGSNGSLNVTIGKSDGERTNESTLTAKSNLSGSSATLEDSELHDMTVADSIADAIGENLLKNASLVMSPNVGRNSNSARKSNGDNAKLVLDVRQFRRADNKKCDTPTRS